MLNAINTLQALRDKSTEEGFTLIELMIVVVIIGILAAIAIPIFMNQQKMAVAATLKSDAKNTANDVATTLVKTPTASDVSGLVAPTKSKGNTVTVTGAWDDYTVRAVNKNGEPNCYEFKSLTGKLTECEATPGEVEDNPTPGGEVELPADADSTCIAYDYNGNPTDECGITSITYDSFTGENGVNVRNYFINLDVPSSTRSVGFDVDLSQATGAISDWSWSSASVDAGTSTFSPADGWNCEALPRLRGTGADWQTSTIYVQVAERATGMPSMCS